MQVVASTCQKVLRLYSLMCDCRLLIKSRKEKHYFQGWRNVTFIKQFLLNFSQDIVASFKLAEVKTAAFIRTKIFIHTIVMFLIKCSCSYIQIITVQFAFGSASRRFVRLLWGLSSFTQAVVFGLFKRTHSPPRAWWASWHYAMQFILHLLRNITEFYAMSPLQFVHKMIW